MNISRDKSIDYLRMTLTLMVLAHHSSLAYTSWAFFDRTNVWRSTSPIVDSHRWAFFDYAENFNDVFFMALMFFVSGLFVYPAILRHGTLNFMRDRMLRLGLPFAAAVVLIMPIAYYASWQLGDKNRGFLDFYAHLSREGFRAGPPWFIWVLLLFDLLIAALLIPARQLLGAMKPFMECLRGRSLLTFVVLLISSSCLYLPLLYQYGFSRWTVFLSAPFAFQVSRIGLYALWFIFGVMIGSPGFENGLLSRSGSLARHWPLWMAGCVIAYNLLYFLPRLLSASGATVAQTRLSEALLWVFSCVASCFGCLALFRGRAMQPRHWLNSLSRSAYVMYLIHYVFVTWTQRLVLHMNLHASVKFLMVFGLTLLLSWFSAQAFLRVPGLKAIL